MTASSTRSVSASSTRRMTVPIIEARGVSAGYGASQVLRGIDFAVHAGETIGLMGRNGMGKTTLIRTLLGLLPTHSGSVLLDGADAGALSVFRRARRGIAVVPENRGVFASLSVVENLRLAARPGEWGEDRVLELFPRLRERHRNRGNQLSGGEQQMLAIGRALMTNPRLLVLDEATEGLAPLVRDEMWHTIRVVRDSGIAVVVVDKTVSAVLSLADSVTVLVKGGVVYSGTPDLLREDAELMHRHLGI
jgi:branched-chain amino acid transport system ATP-binding protein